MTDGLHVSLLAMKGWFLGLLIRWEQANHVRFVRKTQHKLETTKTFSLLKFIVLQALQMHVYRPWKGRH